MEDGGRLSELMRLYQKGEGDVLREIYRLVAPGMTNYLYRFCGDRAVAEDLLQEVFLRVHKVRHTFRPESPVKPWLYSIARYVAIDDLRKRARRREIPFEDAHGTLGDQGNREKESAADEWEEVEKALSQIPKAQKEAFLLTKVAGLSVREAAAVMGTTEGALKVKVHRAIRAVQRLVNQEPQNMENQDEEGREAQAGRNSG